MNAQHLAKIGFFGLLALQLVWHAWLAPPQRAPVALVLAIALLPLLPALLAYPRNPRRGVLWAGAFSLFYFCHGVAEAWTAPEVRVLATAEIVLSLLLIGALGWNARHYTRKS